MPNGWPPSDCRMAFQAGAMTLVSSAASRRGAARSRIAANRNRRSTTDFIDWFSLTYVLLQRSPQFFSPRGADARDWRRGQSSGTGVLPVSLRPGAMDLLEHTGETPVPPRLPQTLRDWRRLRKRPIESRFLIGLSFAATRLATFTQTHGLRHGLPSIAAPQLFVAVFGKLICSPPQNVPSKKFLEPVRGRVLNRVHEQAHRCFPWLVAPGVRNAERRRRPARARVERSQGRRGCRPLDLQRPAQRFRRGRAHRQAAADRRALRSVSGLPRF